MEKEKIPRQINPAREVNERINDFNEVYLGFDEDKAIIEASRCLQCKKPKCQLEGCPLHNRIPEWIKLIKEKKFKEAAELTRTTSSMPEICSRVCPQNRLCEGACVLGVKQEPVAIGALERFVNDYIRKHNISIIPQKEKPTGKKVACIGSGPASLAVAEQLLPKGHSVTIFERWPRPGGVLIYGIPGFKIDRKIIEERIDLLKQLGAQFICNREIKSVDELFDSGFDAVFIGIGASKGSIPKIEGVELENIYQATEFLVRANLPSFYLPQNMQKKIDVKDKQVFVMGGGDTAMDCARTAIRLKAKDVKVVYRRDEENMPGSKKEVKAAKEEGVEFIFLTAPVKFIGKDNKIVAVECVKMQLGEPDSSGRRKPIEIKGSNFNIPTDIVVLAFGYEIEQDLLKSSNIKVNNWGGIVVDPSTFATNRKGVFAGGDCVNGADLVVTATANGRIAANSIHNYLLSI
jgi:glutamate synthase (NADPH/NADH) small chain